MESSTRRWAYGNNRSANSSVRPRRLSFVADDDRVCGVLTSVRVGWLPHQDRERTLRRHPNLLRQIGTLPQPIARCFTIRTQTNSSTVGGAPMFFRIRFTIRQCQYVAAACAPYVRMTLSVLRGLAWGLRSMALAGCVAVVVAPAEATPPLSGVAAIAAGAYHTCALSVAGGVACWGDGRLGDRTTSLGRSPVTVSGLDSGVAAIAAGADHTCALTTNGGVLCWGTTHPASSATAPPFIVPRRWRLAVSAPVWRRSP